MADEFLTKAEFIRFKKILVKHLDTKFGEVYQEIAAGNDAETQVADEAVEKAERAQRHARRVDKLLREHIEGHGTDE